MGEQISAKYSSLTPSFPIIWRDSVEYERARVGRVFNYRRPSRFPIAVVEASCERHIVEAVRLANEIGCRVAVRSGGHSWAAWSVRDDSILIDLGKYHEFSLDEKTRILKASPSTTGRLLNTLLADKGLMFQSGHCPEVAVGGFLLQGGMGWNCKNWGWSCEQVLGIDVVAADGRQLYCDKNKNSDLYWAARGAGPGFPAVVTRFYLQCIPSYSHMRSSAYIYDLKDYRKAFEWAVAIAPEFDASTEVVCVGSTPPGQSETQLMILFVTFKNSEEEARAALRPAEVSAPPGHVDRWFAKETSLPLQYDDQHAANPSGHRYCADNVYVNNDADVVSVMEKAVRTLPSKKSFALWYSMNPCSRRSVADGTFPDMALSMHTDHYFAAYTIWEKEEDDMQCQGWVRDIFAEAEKHSEGSYLGDADFQVRQTRFWQTEQGSRLMAVRKKYDPEGRIVGYLDAGDKSQVDGLKNEHTFTQDKAVVANL